jgi:predicted RNase H-like HicB family nuclease
MATNFNIETEQEQDGRWLADVVEIPGGTAYGSTPHEAIARVQALALRVLAERIEQGEVEPEYVNVSFQAA